MLLDIGSIYVLTAVNKFKLGEIIVQSTLMREKENINYTGNKLFAGILINISSISIVENM